MATHSSILAWRIPWTEEAGGLQSKGLKRVRHDWARWLSLPRESTHSSILIWRIPWMEEPGGVQSMGLQRVGHDWVTERASERESLRSSLPLWVSWTLQPIWAATQFPKNLYEQKQGSYILQISRFFHSYLGFTFWQSVLETLQSISPVSLGAAVAFFFGHPQLAFLPDIRILYAQLLSCRAW